MDALIRCRHCGWTGRSDVDDLTGEFECPNGHVATYEVSRVYPEKKRPKPPKPKAVLTVKNVEVTDPPEEDKNE